LKIAHPRPEGTELHWGAKSQQLIPWLQTLARPWIENTEMAAAYTCQLHAVHG
jgi:hypothetical protein